MPEIGKTLIRRRDVPRHVRPTHKMQRAFLVCRTSVHWNRLTVLCETKRNETKWYFAKWYFAKRYFVKWHRLGLRIHGISSIEFHRNSDDQRSNITNRRRAVGVHHTNSRHDLYTVTVLKMRRLNLHGSIQSPFKNPPGLTHYRNTRS